MVGFYSKLRVKLEKLKRVQQPLTNLSMVEAIKQAHESIITLTMLRDYYGTLEDNVDEVIKLAITDVNKNIVNTQACIVETFNDCD